MNEILQREGPSPGQVRVTSNTARTVSLSWAVLVPLALLFAVTLTLVGAIIWLNGDGFVYALDDAYIHLAMAKNLATHGVWGATPHAFTAASSSPIWVFLLAALSLVTGPDRFAPLLLNLAFAATAIVLIAVMLERSGVRRWLTALITTALMVATPLPVLIAGGMEHSLHVLLVASWVFAVLPALEAAPSTKRLLALTTLACLLVACRFESAALVAVTGALLARRGRWRVVFAIGAASALPLVLHAIVSLRHGWHALPNSVLTKMAARDWHTPFGVFQSLGGKFLWTLPDVPLLAALLVLAVLIFWRASTRSRELLVMFVAVTALHLQFAQVGWLFRYEAYLIVLGVLCLVLAWPAEWRQAWLVAGAAVILLVPATMRSINAYTLTALAAKNIHDQQWQLGRFVASQLNGRRIVLNDIGCVSYLSDPHIIDLAGLASLGPGDQIRKGGHTRETIDYFAKAENAEFAILTTSRFHAHAPESWVRVGTWTAQGFNAVLTDPTVSFYATDAKLVPELRERLMAFSKAELAEDVQVAIIGP